MAATWMAQIRSEWMSHHPNRHRYFVGLIGIYPPVLQRNRWIDHTGRTQEERVRFHKRGCLLQCDPDCRTKAEASYRPIVAFSPGIASLCRSLEQRTIAWHWVAYLATQTTLESREPLNLTRSDRKAIAPNLGKMSANRHLDFAKIAASDIP
jgi:hypothetical protein